MKSGRQDVSSSPVTKNTDGARTPVTRVPGAAIVASSLSCLLKRQCVCVCVWAGGVSPDRDSELHALQLPPTYKSSLKMPFLASNPIHV